MNKQTFQIPPNCKFITQEVIDNKIITTFDFGPEFKIGDIVECVGDIHIISKIENDSLFFDVIVHGDCNEIDFHYNDWGKIKKFRYATEPEKQKLFYCLAKKGKKWNPETLCIEDLKVIPKVGDCVRIDFVNGERGYFVCGYVGDVIKSKGNVLNIQLNVDKQMDYHLGCNFTVLYEDQFQSELNDLGFEYNFENDTISEWKWKPKEGEEYYYIDSTFRSSKTLNNWGTDIVRLSIGNYFKTKEECEEAIEKIKNILK